jgi:Mrp family chromosome partitioning ATPase
MDRKLLHGKAGSGKVIQFTASHHGEGATSIALAFASYLAKVHDPSALLLVEANFRRPAFRSLLCVEGGPSFDDILNGASTLEETVRVVEETRINVVASVAPREAHESPQFQERAFDLMAPFLEGLRSKYATVLLDTAPAVPYIDSAIISGMVDAVVLVVESNLTKSHVVDHSLEKLRASGGKIEGLILNKREFFIPKWLYRFL